MIKDWFLSPKRDFVRQLESADSIDSISTLLQQADRFYTKHKIAPMNGAFNEAGQDVESKLSTLKRMAADKAVGIILTQHNLLDLHKSMVDLKKSIDETLTDIDYDLHTHGQLQSILSCSAIVKTQAKLNEFADAKSHWPETLYRMCPDMTKFSNPYADKTYQDFSKIGLRRDVFKTYRELSTLLGETDARLIHCATTHMARYLPAPAATIFGQVVKNLEQDPACQAAMPGL